MNTNQRMGWGTPREAGGNINTPPPIVGLAQAVFFFEHIANHTVSDYNVHFFIVGSPPSASVGGGFLLSIADGSHRVSNHFSAQLSHMPASTSKRTPGNIVCTASSIAVSTSALISSAVSVAHSTISSS